MKTGVFLADLHCGHRAGLTPPDYWDRDTKWCDAQAEGWERYTKLRGKIGKVDFVVCNGDAIDGRGQTSGGTELITTSLAEQAKMAVECLAIWKAKKYVLSRGTDFHVAWAGEDWEDFVADGVREKLRTEVIIKDHPFIEVGGVTIDIKHHVGGTSVPYAGGTAILRDKMWNEQWYLDGEGQPLADVILRAHVHVFGYYGGMRNDRPWVAIRQPALQMAGTKYGGRRCSSIVHWGIISAKIDNGEFDWTAHACGTKANKVEAVKL